MPAKHLQRGRLWLADGARMRRRAERPQVWSDDVVCDRTADGRPLRLLASVDADPRACLRLDVARRRRSDDVLARLAQRFVARGPPTSLRSDNGPACTATAVRDWLTRVGVPTLFIAPGSPWENGDGESCNGTLRDEGRDPEIFTTLPEAQIRIQRWRREYNQIRPHSALGYPPPPRPGNAGDPTSPPRLLRRPAGPGTNLTTGTTIGGRSPAATYDYDRVSNLGQAAPTVSLQYRHPNRLRCDGLERLL